MAWRRRAWEWRRGLYSLDARGVFAQFGRPESAQYRARNARIRVTACGVGAVAEYNVRRTRVAWRASARIGVVPSAGSGGGSGSFENGKSFGKGKRHSGYRRRGRHPACARPRHPFRPGVKRPVRRFPEAEVRHEGYYAAS